MALKDKIKTTVGGGSISKKSLLVPNNAMFNCLFGKNIGAAPIYLHFVDSATLPIDGAVTHKFAPMLVAAGDEFCLQLSPKPVVFTNGICIYGSSTDLLKTIILTDDIVATLQYSDGI
jgi:hypothetical protein